MKILTTLFCCGIIFQLTAQEYKKESYDNGAPLSEGAYTASDLKTGVWKYFYPNGKLKVEADTMAHGNHYFYDSLGNLDYTIVYDSGQPKDTIQANEE